MFILSPSYSVRTIIPSATIISPSVFRLGHSAPLSLRRNIYFTASKTFTVAFTSGKETMASSEPLHPSNPMDTEGARDPVWIHREPYSNRPRFQKLNKDVDDVDVCVVGAGISGISSAYELVTRGFKVVLIEAREVLSGQSGRTSGHLSNAVDDPYIEIAKKHGVSLPTSVVVISGPQLIDRSIGQWCQDTCRIPQLGHQTCRRCL